MEDKIKDQNYKDNEADLQQFDNPEENLLGVFSILFEVAKRTNSEKYLVGYKNQND